MRLIINIFTVALLVKAKHENTLKVSNNYGILTTGILTLRSIKNNTSRGKRSCSAPSGKMRTFWRWMVVMAGT
jgi:hypothetical protein